MGMLPCVIFFLLNLPERAQAGPVFLVPDDGLIGNTLFSYAIQAARSRSALDLVMASGRFPVSKHLSNRIACEFRFQFESSFADPDQCHEYLVGRRPAVA